MSVFKKLAGQTAIYGSSSIIGRFLNFLLTPLYALQFTNEQYGIITEMYAYVAFLVVLLTYGMETSYFRFSTLKEHRSTNVYSNTLYSLLTTSSFFVVLISIFSQDIANWLQYPNHFEYIIWFGIIVALDAISSIPLAKLRSQARAKKFALECGFKEENLLTEKSERAWRNWLKKQDYQPEINIENHDTIGMLALDENGNLSGACTTSGAAWKMHGRVGDSPIIGAGLYVDNEIGAATATGLGEFVIKICGSHMIVELMRQGLSPMAACKAAIDRIVKKYPDNYKDLQVGFLALSKAGEYGAYGIHKGFNYAVKCNDQNQLIDSGSYTS